MASTISEYLKKSAEYHGGGRAFIDKMDSLGHQYSTLDGFKKASISSIEALKKADGAPFLPRLRKNEKELILKIQQDIIKGASTEMNFVNILSKSFIEKQLAMLEKITIDSLNTNPILCTALKFNKAVDLIKYNVYALATRSIVTSMGYFVQDLLLYSNLDVHQGKDYHEGRDVKWDIVVERLDAVRCYIEVKSGPNDLDKGQVKSYAKEIDAVEKDGHKGIIGITYGKREADTVSINLFKEYLTEWEEHTLIGTELWDYVSGDEEYHTKLTDQVRKTANAVLSRKSIIKMIDAKVVELTKSFNEKYGNVESYISQLW